MEGNRKGVFIHLPATTISWLLLPWNKQKRHDIRRLHFILLQDVIIICLLPIDLYDLLADSHQVSGSSIA